MPGLLDLLSYAERGTCLGLSRLTGVRCRINRNDDDDTHSGGLVDVTP